MKTIIFAVLATAFFACNAPAQEVKKEEVPAAVKTAFEKLYPNVKDVDWEKEDANYEAEFELNKAETAVVFSASGTLLETETEIKASELPKAATDYVTKNYPGKKINEAAKMVAADGTVTYEAEVGESDLIFDANGNFLKAIKETKEDKED